MASTVHNGSITAGSSYTYTNNTGKNVRIVINILHFGQSGSNCWVYIGTSTSQTGTSTSIAFEIKAGQVFGKHLGYFRNDSLTSEGSSGELHDDYMIPLEFFIPDSSFFEIEIPGNHNKKTMYNFISITED